MEREHTMFSQKEHMRSRGEVYIGSQTPSTRSVYMIDDFSDEEHKTQPKFMSAGLYYSPAAYKIIDEILVNAVDHYINYPGKVTRISIDIDVNSGIFQIVNDGPGIRIYPIEISYDKNGEPTAKHYKNGISTPNPNAVIKYLPQFLSEQPNTGNNLLNRKTHITGGVNGSGMKLTNYYSEFFIIETVDGDRKLHYIQKMEANATKINEPIIKASDQAEFTKIIFKPDYSKLGYTNASKNDFAILAQIVKTRSYQIASYIKAQVYFQSRLVGVKTIEDLGRMFAPEIQEDSKKDKKKSYAYSCQLVSLTNLDDENKPLVWNVCVGPSMTEKFTHMSVVNGMYIIEGGTHIDYLIDQILEYFEKEINKVAKLIDTSKNRIRNNLYIVMVGAINKPSTSSQSKEKIGNDKKQYEGYKFDNKQLKEIWNLCEPFVMTDILEKGTTKRNRKIVFDKYKPAKYCTHKKKAHLCHLFIPEGDSACNLIDKALSNKKLVEFTSDYYGYYSIQGVPMNARSYSKKILNPKTGKEIKIYSEKIHSNKRLEGLYQALGLDETKTYDITPQGDEEFATLNYGSVIIATDQDEDGKGNIASLIINYFLWFWPSLIKRGYIRRLNTPLVRAYNKSTHRVYGFYSLKSFHNWQSTVDTSNYETTYYKGLARHDAYDIEDIFLNFNRNLHIYKYDETCEQLGEEYFGSVSQFRKDHLRAPVTEELPEDVTLIPVSMHFKTDTCSYKHDKVTKMLPHVNDGLLNTYRKIIFTVLTSVGKTQSINVSTLAGLVRSVAHHHHGDSAISNSIIHLGQEFLPNLLPLLLGNSICEGFGSRKYGGHNAGQPRYLELKPNSKLTDLLFPLEDSYMLPHVKEEGHVAEPKYYMPIIPLALLRSYHHPAHGWDINCWARDWRVVMRNIRTAIKSYKLVEGKSLQIPCSETRAIIEKNNHTCPEFFDIEKLVTSLENMPIDVTNWKGTTKYVQAVSKKTGETVTRLFSIGSYVYDPKANKIIVTELPHGISSNQFAFGNRKLIEKRKAELKKEEAKRPPATITYNTALMLASVNKPIIDDEELDLLMEDIENEELDLSLEKVDNKVIEKIRQIIGAAAVDRPYVKYVKDESTDTEVEIHIELEKGGYEAIQALGNSEFDGVIEHFRLRSVIHDSLNFIEGNSDFIQEYKNYDEIFRVWFIERKKLYEERFRRRLIITELQIMRTELIQRYCDEIKVGKFTLSRKTKLDQMKILEENGYPRLSNRIINDPKFIAIDKIRFEALENKSNLDYKYITDLNMSQTSDDDYQERAEEIRKLKGLLNSMKTEQEHFNGAKWWLAELNKLESVIELGLKNGWGYDLPKKIRA